MQTIKNILKNINKEDLKINYYNALKDENFKRLRNLIPLEDEYLMNYTYLLKDSSKELENCRNCKGLNFCKNELPGYIFFPTINEKKITFGYNACKYTNKIIKDTKYYKNVDLYKVPENLRNAKIKDIYTDDESRIEVIKYIDKFISDYLNNIKNKGIYLSGNFGSGKTYLISALFNELAKNNIKSSIIYFPELLRTLKSSFSDYEDTSFQDKISHMKKVPLLLIDDIGAENVTAWSRDEILGTILQYRMDENLPTFFTSNLTVDELEIHLSITSNKIDKVKARRIIERIKYLSKEIKLIGVNRRS